MRKRPVTKKRPIACAVCGQGMKFAYRNYHESEDGTVDRKKFDCVCGDCVKQRRPFVAKPEVLLAKEHHQTWHYLVRDDQELFKTALSILRRRHKDGCYYYKPDEKDCPRPAELAAINADEAAAQGLRKGKMRDTALADCTERLEVYQRDVERFKQEQREWDMIVEALAIHDGRMAWGVLWERSGGEDEGLELETFADIEEQADA